MLDRLSTVVGALADAAGRRGASAPPGLVEVVAALVDEHGRGQPGVDEPDDALAELARGFSLTALDTRLLAVAAAGELDANVALASGLLAGTGAPAWPSVGLALELCGVTTLDAAARTRLNPLAPLRFHGLLRLHGDGPWLSRRLVVPSRVGAHLGGDDTVDPLLVGCLEEWFPVDLAPAADLSAALRRGVRLCWLRSPQGSAGASVAVAAVLGAGATPFVVDLARVADQLDVGPTVSAAALEAGLLGQPLVLVGAERLVPAQSPPLVDLLDACVVPVLGVASRQWDPLWSPRVPFVVEAPRLDLPARVAVWTEAAAAQDVALDLDDDRWPDVLAMRLTPGQIVRATRDADLAATVAGRTADVGDLRQAVRRLARNADQAPVRTTASFDDLVLPPPALDELHRLVSWARLRDGVLAQGPLNGAGGKGSGIAALFGGGPGTGKTLAAHVVSDALGLDLMRVDLSSVVDKYVGETEKNLERIFHEAESMNVVLFFDEADALFGARSAVNDARDRYANLEVSYLLQRMEDFDGITILATNLRGNLDPAFSRRLQFLITFPDPDATTRLRLWQRHLAHVARLDDADPPRLDLLADHAELAGGDIRNIVLSAAYAAAGDNDGRVAMRHVLEAAGREYAKLRKRLPEQLAAPLPGLVPATLCTGTAQGLS